MTKIELVRLAAIIALGAAWTVHSSGQEQEEGTLSVKQVEPDFYVIEGTSNGSSDAGNVGIYVTDEGVALVDDRFDRNYRQVLAAVKELTNQPVRYVVNTHHHGDHTGTNAAFLAANVQVVAHANARQHMVDGKMAGLPGIVFTTQASVFLGGKEIRAIYNGRGHTDGDVAVYLPQRKTVMLGDLMAGTRGVTNPVMDYASGGSISEWPATLDGVLKLDIDHVVPGHGAVGSKADLLAHRNKVDRIKARVTGLVRKKQSKEEITKVLIDEFDYKPINLRPLDGMIAELRR